MTTPIQLVDAPKAFIIHTPPSTLTPLQSQQQCMNYLKKGKLYLRGNNFTFSSIADFNQRFTLSDNSKQKTVQEITNCYDASLDGTRRDTLDEIEYKGLFPCLELNAQSGISKIISRIKDQVGPAALKSFLLFFTLDEPMKSQINNEGKEITRVTEFDADPTFNGIIQTDCNAKLVGGLQHASSETIITPRFRGMILYSTLEYGWKGDHVEPIAILSQWINRSKPAFSITESELITQLKYSLVGQCVSNFSGGKNKKKSKKRKKKKQKRRKTKKQKKTNKSKK